MVRRLQRIFREYPGWHIAMRVDVRGREKAWPLMGLLIFRGRMIDYLKREVLPEECRGWRYD
ncbi:MAG TPA: hypothetical protein VFQ87_09490 [Bradyrhizobium sp.]|nr:hypothetical protein [Bradyrhizobium sp.]